MDVDNPVVKMRKFFSHGSKVGEVLLPEMTHFWKVLSEAERAEFKAAVLRWDGQSEFIPAAITAPLALPPSSVVVATA